MAEFNSAEKLNMDFALLNHTFTVSAVNASTCAEQLHVFHYSDHSELYIGSSNISRSALTSGIEWNYRFNDITDQKNYNKFFRTFEELFENHSIIIDNEELKRYSRNWHRPAVSRDLEKYDETEEEPEDTKVRVLYEPRGAQIEALCALEDTRAEGAKKALVQAATGERVIIVIPRESAVSTRALAA